MTNQKIIENLEDLKFHFKKDSMKISFKNNYMIFYNLLYRSVFTSS